MLTLNLQVRSYKGQRSLLHDPGFEQGSMHRSRSKACSDVQPYRRGTVLSGCNISSLQLPDSLQYNASMRTPLPRELFSLPSEGCQ